MKKELDFYEPGVPVQLSWRLWTRFGKNSNNAEPAEILAADDCVAFFGKTVKKTFLICLHFHWFQVFLRPFFSVGFLC
jgi:hypothetical protein